MQPDLPSRLPVTGRKLLRASAGALLAAAAIFVVAVLPAEYGIDPLGTGKALGLLAINPLAPPSAPILNTGLPVQSGPMTHYPGVIQFDSVALTVNPYDYVEYKYHLARGASMVFSWQADAPLIHEFHGEPDTYPKDKVQSYDKSRRQAGNGSLVAPFNGIHGWYWENPGSTPIHVKLVSAGYYTQAVQIKSNHVRIAHAVRPLAEMATGNLSKPAASGKADVP